MEEGEWLINSSISWLGLKPPRWNKFKGLGITWSLLGLPPDTACLFGPLEFIHSFKDRLCIIWNGLPCTSVHFWITYLSDWCLNCISWKEIWLNIESVCRCQKELPEAIFKNTPKTYVEIMLKQPQWYATFVNVCHHMLYRVTLALCRSCYSVLHTRKRFLERMHTLPAQWKLDFQYLKWKLLLIWLLDGILALLSVTPIHKSFLYIRSQECLLTPSDCVHFFDVPRWHSVWKKNSISQK